MHAHVRQGDVYHLLFNLGEWLDGRVWPRADQLEVLRLLDLIHHVTGMCLSLQAFLRSCHKTAAAGIQVSSGPTASQLM